MPEQRITRYVCCVVERNGETLARLGRVWPDTQFLLVSLKGKVTMVRPTNEANFKGFPGYQVWR